MSSTRGPRSGPPGDESYDTGEWVDVGADGLWRPGLGERMRAAIVLAVALGALLILAAVASVDDGDDPVAVARSTTTEPQVVTTTTIASTTTLDATSVGGEPPPPGCESDDRRAEPLRPRTQTSVLVLNGTPRNGHAGDFTDQLRSLGYTMSVPDNASIRQTTIVDYTAGHCAEAVQVAGDLDVDGAEVRALPDDSDVFLGRAEILVTLGRDSL